MKDLYPKSFPTHSLKFKSRVLVKRKQIEESLKLFMAQEDLKCNLHSINKGNNKSASIRK